MEQKTAEATLMPIEFFLDNIEGRIQAEQVALQSIYSFVMRDRKRQVCAVLSVALEKSLPSSNPEQTLVRLAFKDRDFQTAYAVSGRALDGIVRLDKDISVNSKVTSIHRFGFIMNIAEDDPFDPRNASIERGLENKLMGAKELQLT